MRFVHHTLERLLRRTPARVLAEAPHDGASGADDAPCLYRRDQLLVSAGDANGDVPDLRPFVSERDAQSLTRAATAWLLEDLDETLGPARLRVRPRREIFIAGVKRRQKPRLPLNVDVVDLLLPQPRPILVCEGPREAAFLDALQGSISALLGTWRTLAHRDLYAENVLPLDLNHQLVWVVRDAEECEAPSEAVQKELVLCATATAQHATHAAFQARASILRDPPSVSRESVARFATNYLRSDGAKSRPEPTFFDAVGAALLETFMDDFDPDDQDQDDRLIHRLKVDLHTRRQAWKPLAETEIRGRAIDSLDRPLRLDSTADRELTVADTAGTVDPIEQLLDDGRFGAARQMLKGLQPEEQTVALAYARFAVGWSHAAELCGMPATFGNRVRRKLRRQGRRLENLRNAANATRTELA